MKWTSVDDVQGPPARIGATATMIEDRMYIVGGERSAYSYSDVWSYDFGRQKWSFMPNLTPVSASMPGRWDHATVALSNTTLLVVGGRNSTVSFGDAWLFDVESSEWTLIADNVEGFAPRFGHTCNTITGEVYCYGGYVSGTNAPTTELWKIVPKQSYRFALLGPSSKLLANPNEVIMYPSASPEPRFAHVSVANDENLFVHGGSSGGSNMVFQDLWCFNTVKRTWSLMNNATVPAYDHAAALVDNSMVVFGGYDSKKFVSSITKVWVGANPPTRVEVEE
jgi:N-acetylneuraminic acid mutarotase